MIFKVTCVKTDKFRKEIYDVCGPDGHVSGVLELLDKKYSNIALPIDMPKELETAVGNFAREAKFLILITEDGNTKTLILEEVKEGFENE